MPSEKYLEYLRIAFTSIVMLVLSLLALFEGAGGFWWWWNPFEVHLYVWFLTPFYPLMAVPALKQWYTNYLLSVYPGVDVHVYACIYVGPVPVFGFHRPLTQVPLIWPIFLIHLPYWLALSHGLVRGLEALIRWYNEAVQKALQKAQAER